MFCPRCREQLPLFHSDALASSERAEVEAHLQTCAPCARELRALRLLTQTVASLPAAPSPIAVRANVRAALRQPQRRTFAWPTFKTRGLAWSGALAVAAIGLIVLARPFEDGARFDAPSTATRAEAPALSEPAPTDLQNAGAVAGQKAAPAADSQNDSIVAQKAASAPGSKKSKAAPVKPNSPPASVAPPVVVPDAALQPKRSAGQTAPVAAPTAKTPPPDARAEKSDSPQPKLKSRSVAPPKPKAKDQPAPPQKPAAPEKLEKPADAPAPAASFDDGKVASKTTPSPALPGAPMARAGSGTARDEIQSAPQWAGGAVSVQLKRRAANEPRERAMRSSKSVNGAATLSDEARADDARDAGSRAPAPSANEDAPSTAYAKDARPNDDALVLTLRVEHPVGAARLVLLLPKKELGIWRGTLGDAPLEIPLQRATLEKTQIKSGQKIRARLEQINAQNQSLGSTNLELTWP